MKTRSKKKQIVALVCIAILFISIISITSTLSVQAADTPFTIEQVKDECEQLTSSDVLEGAIPYENGAIPKLGNYIDKINSNYYYADDKRAMQADHLFRIIPQELFLHVGEWFYNGFAYAFYVRTWAGITAEADFFSDVAIIDYTYNLDPNTAEISVKVSLFSRRYMTKKSIIDDSYYTLDYGRSADQYYLSDVAFSTSIYNEHEPNFKDNTYNKLDDTGLIITQTRLNYSGLYNQVFNDPLKPAMEKVTSKLVKAAVGAIPIVGDYYKTIKKIMGVGQDIADCFIDQSVTVDNNNEANIFTNWTKEAQRENQYLEGYIKTAYTKPGVNNEPGLLIDNYAQMITLLNDSNVETRVFAGVSYNLQINDIYRSYIVDSKGKRTLLTTESRDEVEPIIQTYNELAFEQSDTAVEGENNGYLYQSDSSQEFKFTPTRNGYYTLRLDNNHILSETRDFTSQHDELYVNYKCGNTYDIFVKLKDGAADATGDYSLNIDFTPETLKSGENKRSVAAHQHEYYSYFPQESGVYSLSLKNKYSDIAIRIDRVINDSLENIALGSQDLDVYLTSGFEYYIVLMNVGNFTRDTTLVLEPGAFIQQNRPMNVTVNVKRLFTFRPEHNGDYTFTMRSADPLDFSLLDSSFNKLYGSNIGTVVQHRYFYEADKIYYLQIQTYLQNTQVNCSMDFSPPETNGNSIEITNLSNYNIVKFTPQVSATYRITAGNARVNVYLPNKTDVSAQNLNAGAVYYIVIYGQGSSSAKLETTLSCDRLYNNRPYTVKSGKNTVAFIAPETGSYKIQNLDNFTLFSDDYTPLYNQNNKLNLIKDKTYYIEFNSNSSASSITMYFNPVNLTTQGNIVLRNTTFYELNATASQYVFNAKSYINSLVKIQLFDKDLNLLREGDNQLVINLATDKYYIKVNTDNIDTLLSVVSTGVLNSSAIPYYEGAKANVSIAAGGFKVFEFVYNKVETQTRYYLSINETLGENLGVKIYYYSAGQIQEVDLTRTGEVGKYYCDLLKSVGKYYIEVQTNNYKTLELDLYVPAHIQGITINNRDIYQYINSLYFGLGQTYTFRINCNSNATYGAKLKVISNVSGVTFTNNTVTIPLNSSLLNRIIEVSFETYDGNDYRMYQFEIKKPHRTSTYISNDKMYINFYDLYDNPVYDIYNTINYYYYLNGIKTSIAGLGNYVDLVALPNIESVTIYADITYLNGLKDEASAVFRETTYSISDNANLTGKNRVLYDARNSAATQSNTLIIPPNIKTVNIWGISGRTYSSISIYVLDRSTTLTINLNNFTFTSTAKEAILIDGTNTVNINIVGTSNIKTTALGKNAIQGSTIRITGGVLYVYGGNQNILSYSNNATAGSGIKASSITINNCTLYAYGGNGQNGSGYYSGGYTGAHGGTAIFTNYLYVYGSTLRATGGNGANGVNGSNGSSGSSGSNGFNGSGYTITSAHGRDGGNGGNGGNGGRGGDGGYALNINNSYNTSNSLIYLVGGNSGNGGRGGNGGSGGRGGNGAPTANRSGSHDAGHGGKGGNGGNGGNGGAFGSPGNYCTMTITADLKQRGICGYGGEGGSGGNGGSGGKGGDDIQVSGAEASGGNGGNGGKGGNGYYLSAGGSGGYGGSGGSKGDAGGNAAGGVYNGSYGINGAAGYSTSTSYYISLLAGQQQTFKYYSTKTRTITIYTGSNTGDPYLEVFNSSGTRVAYNDDYSGSGLNSRITITLSSYTTYTIVARTYSSSASASYYLYVS